SQLTISPDHPEVLPNEEVLITCKSSNPSLETSFRLAKLSNPLYLPRLQIVRSNPATIQARIYGLSEKHDGLQITCFGEATEKTVTITVRNNCTTGQMWCPDKKCLNDTVFCNGIRDCEDKYDESSAVCPVLPPLFGGFMLATDDHHNVFEVLHVRSHLQFLA
ncbi:hypothetical protein EG68_04086, partial [Paragonimus skrjabini miyazakii]